MKLSDQFLRWRAQYQWSPTIPKGVFLVTLDDQDLKEQGGYEQEYAEMGKVIQEAAALGARVVAVDAIFKRASAKWVKPVAEALHTIPSPVLAEAWLGDGSEPRLQSRFAGEFTNCLAGVINVVADPDGVYRRYPFVQVHNDCAQPSLALAMFLAWRGAEQTQCDTNGVVTWVEEGLERRTVTRKFPLRSSEITLLNYRASWTSLKGVQAGGFIHFSFREFHDLHAKYAAAGRRPLEDAIVLIGYSASGVGDFGATSLGGHQPKLLLHATALADLLQGLSIRRTGAVSDFLGVVIVCLLALAACRSRSKAVLVGIWLLGSLLLSSAGAVLLFKRQLLISSAALTGLWTIAFVLEVGRRHTVEVVERLKLRTTMGYYFSPRVLDYVLRNPASMEPQEGTMTVLLTDIRNFTTITETIGARATFDLLNRVFEVQTQAVLEENGSLEHFLGDQFLAYWGAPEPQSDATERAWRAAEKIRRRLAELQQSLTPEINTLFGFGVAVHRGRGLFGNKGSLQRLDFGLLGDFLNEAARVESLTKYYGVPLLMTGTAYNDLSTQPPARLVDRVLVKGKTKAVELYELQDSQLPERFAQLRDRYTRAFERYCDGGFAEAGSLFQEMVKEFQDGPSRLLAERCRQLQSNPPSGWSGIFEFQSK